MKLLWVNTNFLHPTNKGGSIRSLGMLRHLRRRHEIHYAALADPRQSWRVVYPLPEILLLVLCGTLTGMEDFVEITLWGEQRLDFLRRFLPYERGIPAHDTLNDVVNALDPEIFKACFTSWVETLREHRDWIVHIHLADTRRRNPGTGSYDYDRFFGLLKEIGYGGLMSAECRIDNPAVDMAHSHAFLRRYWPN